METSEIESQFPLDQLPALAIEVIARNLDNRDVAACCAVSRGVRDAFDDELVWRPRYDEERTKYLLNTPCKVQPGFDHPVTHNSGLSPISEWRVAFMAENHLWNNLRQGKFKDEEIKTKIEKPQNVRQWNNLSEYHKFLTSDFVIAAFQERIEVLDVRDYPATHAVEPIPLTLRSTTHVVEANDMILVLYNRVVQVYQLNFSSKQWNINHTFLMDEHEKLSVDKIDKVKEDFGKREPTAKYVVAGKHIFVGFLNGDSTMHIWNFETGVKLKKELCPIKNAIIESIKASNSNLILAVKQRENNSSLFLAYDLSKLLFLPFNEATQGSYEYCVFGDHISIWADRKLHIYDYQHCKAKISNHSLERYELKTLGNDIVFLQARTLKRFNHSKCVFETLLNGVMWFEVLSNKFIQVKLYRDGSVCSRVEIFEIEPSKTLRKISLTLEFMSCGYYLNKSATRYIVRYADGHVLHFW